MTITTNPPAIWRDNKKFPQLIGKKAKIECFSKLNNSCENVVAIVKLKSADNAASHKMTVQLCRENSSKLKVGAEVVLVSRKFDTNQDGLIKYTIKGKLL